MTTPADELRTAATTLHEISTTTPPGAWEAAGWIPLGNPALVAMLGDLFDAAADAWPRTATHTSTHPVAAQRRTTLAMARAINRTTRPIPTSPTRAEAPTMDPIQAAPPESRPTIKRPR